MGISCDKIPLKAMFFDKNRYFKVCIMRFTVVNGKRVFKCICVLVLVIALLLLLPIADADAVFMGKTSRKLPIYRVQTDEKKVAISFDCAWGVDYTDSLLQTMEAEGVNCTFFTVEFWTKKYPEYIKKISSLGHEIGTHSATHPHMAKLDKSAIIKELSTSKLAIEELTGKKVEVFRPPFGEYNDLLIDTAFELDLISVQWDVDSLDWKDLSAKEIENRVVSRVQNGSIVLFHNQGLHTHEALPNIIRALKKKGFTFVRIGDLVYKENYTMLPDGTQSLNS